MEGKGYFGYLILYYVKSIYDMEFRKDVISSLRLGLLDGFAHSAKQPIVMLRTLYNGEAYSKLMDRRRELSDFASEHYFFPPFKIENRGAYSIGYRTGAHIGIASSTATLGLLTVLAKGADWVVENQVNKFYPRNF